jgi:hypothetical protein
MTKTLEKVYRFLEMRVDHFLSTYKTTHKTQKHSLGLKKHKKHQKSVKKWSKTPKNSSRSTVKSQAIRRSRHNPGNGAYKNPMH